MREAFDRNRNEPNPYKEPETCKSPRLVVRLFPGLILAVVTMRSLRQQLNEDETRQQLQGHTPLHAVSSSAFLECAIQIEEQQYVLHCTLVPTHH